MPPFEISARVPQCHDKLRQCVCAAMRCRCNQVMEELETWKTDGMIGMIG